MFLFFCPQNVAAVLCWYEVTKAAQTEFVCGVCVCVCVCVCVF